MKTLIAALTLFVGLFTYSGGAQAQVAVWHGGGPWGPSVGVHRGPVGWHAGPAWHPGFYGPRSHFVYHPSRLYSRRHFHGGPPPRVYTRPRRRW